MGTGPDVRVAPAEAEFIFADVRNEQDVSDLVDGTVARFGRLDVAVNNAGTEGAPGPVTTVSAEAFATMFNTNVLGTLLGLKHELRVMRRLISTATPRSRTSPRKVACPPAISRALFARQQGCHPIDGS
jgi:NAD(P)-dependent dehydrogenase (short-subunit alcohol dehydrogenase family)